MKKLITWKLLLAFTATILSQDVTQATAQGGAKYSLAVLELEGSGRVSSADAGDLSDRLREELRRGGVFQVMDKSALKNALAGRGMNMAGCSAKECAVQAGRVAGTKLIIAGSVSKVGPMYFIQAQLIHVKTGEVVESVSEDFDGEFDALLNHMAVVARKLSGQGSSTTSNTAPPVPSRTNTEAAQQAPAMEKAEPSDTAGEDTFDFQERAVSDRTSKGGSNTLLVIGLVAVGAIGGGLLINQALKKDDNDKGGTTPPPPTTGNLPNPPTFP